MRLNADETVTTPGPIRSMRMRLKIWRSERGKTVRRLPVLHEQNNQTIFGRVGVSDADKIIADRRGIVSDEVRFGHQVCSWPRSGRHPVEL
jgi:hypothetical protein